MKNAKLKIKNCRIGYIIIATFYILHFTFYILASPAFAAEARQEVIKVGAYCFRESECVSYNAHKGPQPSPECQMPSATHNQTAIDRQFIYNCYADPQPYTLQVSIGGRTVTGLENYIQRLYNYLLGIVGIVAGIMIVWAGIKWLTAGALPERIEDAKKKIAGALMGLILALASYVILQTVNPALVNLRLPPIKIARPELLTTEQWCINRPEFNCGQEYECSDQQSIDNGVFPCGQPKGGQCFGPYCASGGCHRVLKDKVSLEISRRGMPPALVSFSNTLIAEDQKRFCANPATCSGNCDELSPPADLVATEATPEQLEEILNNLRTCASTACGRCFVTQVDNGLRCLSKRRLGESCDTDAMCESGVCNRAWSNQCGPSQNGTTCERDIDCESNLCNLNTDSGLAKCVAPNSIEEGEFCSDNQQCQSGLLCRGPLFMSPTRIPFLRGKCRSIGL